eukprot:1605343-Prymnesium_polylepis.1
MGARGVRSVVPMSGPPNLRRVLEWRPSCFEPRALCSVRCMVQGRRARHAPNFPSQVTSTKFEKLYEKCTCPHTTRQITPLGPHSSQDDTPELMGLAGYIMAR